MCTRLQRVTRHKTNFKITLLKKNILWPDKAGILPIEGTIGNITFFKSGDGFMVRQKGGVSGDKIATAPAFERTRKTWPSSAVPVKLQTAEEFGALLIQKAADPR